MSDHDVAAIKDALYAKGPYQDEIARLEPLVVEMAGAVVESAPGLTWRWNRDVQSVPCEAIPGDPTSASAWTLRNLVFDGPIPDSAWPQTLSRIEAIAARVGAGAVNVRVDKPGHHDIQLIGTDKVQFGVISREASVITSRTGCYLTPSDLDAYGS